MSGYIVLGAAVLAALVAAFLERRHTACTIKRLDQMLTAAMDGSLSEQNFDESRLSALENRLGRYLAASALSGQNMRRQNEQISTLISDISHLTKTPVANLQLYTQLLQEQTLQPQANECVQAIALQTEKLQSLMEALVKTSRLESGILAQHPQPGEIAPVIHRASAQYAAWAAAKNIALQVGPAEGRAVFDAKWTEEALCNLLDNAVKYTPAGGSVYVCVHNYQLFSAVCVSNTGPGICEQEQAKIFGRFYRSVGAHQTQGVGIGLYLTRQIAEKQGGYVKIASEPGRKTTFSLYLPRENVPAGDTGCK